MSLIAHSQNSPNSTGPNVTPNGSLENVFDSYGRKYKLSDIIIGNDVLDSNAKVLSSTSPTPVTYGYFNLYFESGCGMENSSNPTQNTINLARRAVVGRVFTDISNFIVSPLSTPGNTNRVNIWVRNINNVIVAPNSPNGIPGLASSFFNMPYNTTNGFGGIADNEIWKTIHLGRDSYTNVVSPLFSNGVNNSGVSGVFYHGMMAFNFSDTTTPINWNTNLSLTSFPGLYDLYSVVLHEVIHAIGFGSMINGTGTPKFAPGFNYFSRFDRLLTNNANTQVLLTNSAGTNPMYDYSFNSALSNVILQPTFTTTADYCSKAIKYNSPNVSVTVYTPTVFDGGSSLSHFDGVCTTPNINYLMSSNIATNTIKRYIRPEERNVLGDIGYRVNTTFGVSTTYQGVPPANYYGTTATTGISVAGMNDGLNTNGTYKYIVAPGQSLTINSTADTFLSNDVDFASGSIVAPVGFESLQDVYDTTARFNTTLTTITGTNNTTVTFTSSIVGLHLLRYVPINGAGLRGNITYIYVFVFQEIVPLRHAI